MKLALDVESRNISSYCSLVQSKGALFEIPDTEGLEATHVTWPGESCIGENIFDGSSELKLKVCM